MEGAFAPRMERRLHVSSRYGHPGWDRHGQAAVPLGLGGDGRPVPVDLAPWHPIDGELPFFDELKMVQQLNAVARPVPPGNRSALAVLLAAGVWLRTNPW